jgi:hypothetical protein
VLSSEYLIFWGRILLCACVLLSVSVRADPHVGYNGLWQGSIGKQAIVVCLATSGGSRYYIVGKLPETELTFVQDDRLAERGDTREAYWQLDPPAADQLTGSWWDGSGNRAARIQLKRSTSPDADACFESYYAPQVAAQEIKKGSAERQQGLTLRRVSIFGGAVSTIELVGNPRFAPINRALKQRWQERAIVYLACEGEKQRARRNRTERLSEGYSYNVALLTAPHTLLSTRESESVQCGNVQYPLPEHDFVAPPERKLIYSSWLRATGEQVNFQTWFNRDYSLGVFCAPVSWDWHDFLMNTIRASH